MNGKNLHLPGPPVPTELQPKQPRPRRGQLCEGCGGGGRGGDAAGRDEGQGTAGARHREE